MNAMPILKGNFWDPSLRDICFQLDSEVLEKVNDQISENSERRDATPLNDNKVEKKINESLTKGSSDTLVESRAYVDPQISKIHELMDKLERK